MNEMYEIITKKKRAQQDAEKALLLGRPTKGMYAYDSDEETEGESLGPSVSFLFVDAWYSLIA